ADKPLRKFQHLISVPVNGGIVPLGFGAGTKRFDGLEFVLPYSAIKDLLLSCLSVKKPGAVCADDGNRKRPIIFAGFQGVTITLDARKMVGDVEAGCEVR